MKRTLVLLFTLFCLYFPSIAQESFTAKEGYEYLKSDDGIIEGKEFINAICVKLAIYTLDFSSGTGNFWVYMFKSKDSTDKKGYPYAVFKEDGDLFVNPSIARADSTMDYSAFRTIDSSWVNSDMLGSNLSSNFLKYVSDNEASLASKQIGLYIDSNGATIWQVFAKTATSSAECLYNAFTLANISCAIPTTGVKDFVKFSGVQVFPNPASDFVNVLLPSDIQTSYQLCNEFGQVLSAGNNQNSAIVNIDLQGIASGVYFLKIQSGDNVIIKKIVKIGE